MEWISGLGPNFTTQVKLAINFNTVLGFSMPATLGGVSPPQTARWLAISGGLALNRGLVQTNSFTPKSVVWLGCRGFTVNGSLAGQGTFSVLEVFGGGGINQYAFQVVEGSAADKYKLRIMDVDEGSGATSTSEFTTDTVYSWLWEFDGVNWNLYVLLETDTWVEAIEATRVDSDKPNMGNITVTGGDIPSGIIVGFSGLSFQHSDEQSEIFDPTKIDVQQIELNGNGPDDEMWNQDVIAKGDADFTDVNNENFTDGWQGEAGQDEQQNCEVETPTIPAGNILVGLMVRSAVSATAQAKTVNTDFYITDSEVTPNERVFVNQNISSDTPRGHHVPFVLAPDGTSWEFFRAANKLPDLRIGVKGGKVGNNANDEWWSILGEFFSLSFTKTPITTTEGDPQNFRRQVIH